MAYLQPRKTERELMFLRLAEDGSVSRTRIHDKGGAGQRVEEREQGPEESYIVKSHVASDISCTFPADSVPPVPALLHILVVSTFGISSRPQFS